MDVTPGPCVKMPIGGELWVQGVFKAKSMLISEYAERIL